MLLFLHNIYYNHSWLSIMVVVMYLLNLNSPLVTQAHDYNVNKEQPQQEQQTPKGKPNIVIILIDDMGFNDVSFHGSNQILTPNIDALAYNGIILNKNYVPNLCTPSRSSLLTGKYPIHTGMHHYVIINDEPWGLPLQEYLMPEIFREAGYATNLVGKWHLGFYRKEMTPLYRGFSHHMGYYSGYIGYYHHDHKLTMLGRNYSGLDMRCDFKPCPEFNGIYATDLFTQEAERIINSHNEAKPLFLVVSHLAVHTGNEDNPLEAPVEEIQKFMYITDPKRRKYAAMLSRLDASVAKTVKALKKKGILDNTIILLYSDNGAPTLGIHANSGSNYPFKGQKESPWEGGIRSAGLIWSPLLKHRNYVSNQVIHAIDWLPTLAAAAGITLPPNLRVDGINVWPALDGNLEPQPRRLLHVYDDIIGYSSYMRGHLKYINGSTSNGQYDYWLGDINFNEIHPQAKNYEQIILTAEVQQALPNNNNLTADFIRKLRQQASNKCPDNQEDYKQTIYKCEPLKAPCYFNLAKDPCERYNLANLYPLQLQFLAQEVEEYRWSVLPSVRIPYGDPLANPQRYNGIWQWWYTKSTAAAHNSGVNSWNSVSFYLILYLCLKIFRSHLNFN